MVRSFLDDPVPRTDLDTLVGAFLRGPSAGNVRSAELLVLTDGDIGAYWDTTLAPERREGFAWPGLLRAPLLLLPYVHPQAYVDRYAEPDKAKTGLGEAVSAWTVPYWWVDGGAAVENVLLAATSMGFGACFFGQFEHEPAVRERFSVPDDRRALGTIAIGRPAPDDRPSSSVSGPKRRRGRKAAHWGEWSL